MKQKFGGLGYEFKEAETNQFSNRWLEKSVGLKTRSLRAVMLSALAV